MEEQHADRIQHIVGNFTASVLGEGNATVNVTLPPPTRQWLKPARPTLSKSFVGRQGLVDTLLADLTSGKHVNITGKAFQGMGGIGKTYLAVQLARELYDSFPGGAIRIDVGPQVTDEASAQLPLSRLASYAFGGIPPLGHFQPEQVAAWLNETAPGPFLVIFDDLWHPTPLRFLSRALPPQAVQLVTTRFANVAQAIGATIVPLERLSPTDGLALLEERLHCQNDMTHRPLLEALVSLLGGYALALEIAAAHIKKPSRLQTVYSELVHGIGQGTLTSLKLSPGEERDENLERSFALSYERLTPEQQHLFRRLGVFAEESLITADAAAAVWGMDHKNAAQNTLFELADLALLTETEDTTAGITSFRQHGLLRVYALALLEKAQERDESSRTHARYYASRSWRVITITPGDYSFLDQNLPNLLIALQWSEDKDSSLFLRLFDNLSQFLVLRNQLLLLERVVPKAVTAAHNMSDKVREANVLVSLGNLERRLSNLDQARTHYDAALSLYRDERAHLGEANALMFLGDLERYLSNLDQASAHYDAALPLYRAERSRLGEAHTLVSLGGLEERLGNTDQARTHYDAALWLFRAIRDGLDEAHTLVSLGGLEERLGNTDQARTHYDAALWLFRAIRDGLGEANVLWSLGEMFLAHEEWTKAKTSYEKALPLYTIERDPLGLANTLIDLGRARFELGDYEQAIQDEQRAADLFHRMKDIAWAERAEQYLAEMRLRVQQQ